MQMFLLDDGEPDLSILTKAGCTEDYCAAVRFNSCFGEVGLKAVAFVSKGFRVYKTPVAKEGIVPGIPHHASVYGMPPFDDEAKARSIAFDLLEDITVRNQRRYKRK
jgi:hypothetical protein